MSGPQIDPSADASTGSALTRERQSRIWARARHEWYVEGEDCTTALLTVERFEGRIHDPACGGGNVVKALLGAGYPDVVGSDLVDRTGAALLTWPFLGTSYFLNDDQAPVDNIVSNPPFGKGYLAEAFARRALQLATRKVALFLPLDFVASDKRIGRFFAGAKPSRAWIITPRPSCPPGDALLQGAIKADGGRANFAWYIWDKADPGPPGMIPMGWAKRGRR